MSRSSRKNKKRTRARRRPINVLASALTSLNLYCGVASIFASIGQEFDTAAKLILLGMVFDLFDGFVARLTNSASEFGKELDSLADIVTFGVAPAVLVFISYPIEPMQLAAAAGRESVIGKTGSYMAIIYAICTALRLARYNTYQSDRRDVFIGLPSPAAGGTIATFVLFLPLVEGNLESTRYGNIAYYVLGPMAVALALLMVSTVRYPKSKLKSFVLAPRRAFQLLGTAAFVIAIAHYAITRTPWLVLFPVAITYVAYGLVETAWQRFSSWRSSSASEALLEEQAEGAPESDPQPVEESAP